MKKVIAVAILTAGTIGIFGASPASAAVKPAPKPTQPSIIDVGNDPAGIIDIGNDPSGVKTNLTIGDPLGI